MQELIELKYKINNDIRDIEILYSENPDNEFLYYEICGLQRALEHVSKAIVEYDALMDKFRDGWELNELNRKDKNNESTLRKTIGNLHT